MPSEAFTALSDEDLAAVIGYLRTVPSVDRETPPIRVGPVARALYLGGNFPLLPVTMIDHDGEARRSGTGSHHRVRPVSGHDRRMPLVPRARARRRRQSRSARYHPGRLGSWTEQDFFRSLREGRRPDGSVIDPDEDAVGAERADDG